MQKLIHWSEQNFHHLPWRKNRSLYNTIVSEFMLQQTTVSTVIPRFLSFIQKFPNFLALHQAKEEEVLHAWEGLGYYSRAKRLYQLSSFFLNKTTFTYEELILLPGIGPYTAQAILGIYFNQPVFAEDTNIKRIKERLQLNVFPVHYSGRLLNEALMDLGRVFCKKNIPLCSSCLLNKDCPSAYLIKENIPVKKKQEIHLLRFFFFNQENHLFLYQRPKNRWLENQFEVPTFTLEPNDQYPLFSDFFSRKFPSVYYLHYKI
jgi:A/G-specific adenine glycosylase